MTLAEQVLLTGGAVFLALFCVRTVAPSFKRRLLTTADRTARDLREEFLFLSPDQTMGILLFAGGLFAVVAILFVKDVGLAAVLGAAPTLMSGLAVRRFRSNRRKKVVSQLPGYLDMISGHARAGHSLQEAILESVSLLPPGIREEMTWISRLIRLGTPLAEALLLWEQRMPCEEISLAVRPLRLALPAGGNIVAPKVAIEEGARFKGSIEMDPAAVEKALGKPKVQSIDSQKSAARADKDPDGKSAKTGAGSPAGAA